jgi:hypothetical protein|tara:strand:- start:2203 stop:2562 length:360 start_codon:yes stop_codon:yes gene_type:complete
VEACPNIGVKEIRMRRNFTLLGMVATLTTIFVILYFNFQQLAFLIFFPAFGTGVVLFETLDKTCIVYAFMGIKNMGLNYEKERNSLFLKSQQTKSILIILKGSLVASILTYLTYLISRI